MKTQNELTEDVIDSVIAVISKDYVNELLKVSKILGEKRWVKKEKVVIDLITEISKMNQFHLGDISKDCPFMTSMILSKMASHICQEQIDAGDFIDPEFKTKNEVDSLIEQFVPDNNKMENQKFKDIIKQCNMEK